MNQLKQDLAYAFRRPWTRKLVSSMVADPTRLASRSQAQMKHPFLASIALCLSAMSLPALAQSDKTAENPVAEKAAKAARAREEAAEKLRAGFARLRFIEGTWKQAKGTATYVLEKVP